jgi:hypothetical protein
MDWLTVSTILPQAPGPKASSPDMGGGLVLSRILTQAPEWLKQIL